MIEKIRDVIWSAPLHAPPRGKVRDLMRAIDRTPDVIADDSEVALWLSKVAFGSFWYALRAIVSKDYRDNAKDASYHIIDFTSLFDYCAMTEQFLLKKPPPNPLELFEIASQEESLAVLAPHKRATSDLLRQLQQEAREGSLYYQQAIEEKGRRRGWW